MSNFSATPLEKLVKKLGNSNADIRKHLQYFETQRKTTDFNAIKVAYLNTPLCVDQTNLADLLSKHEDAHQPLYIDLYNRANFTVANNLMESGYQSGSTSRFAITKQPLIAVKIKIDLANLKRWDAYTTSPIEKWQLEYEYLTMQAWLDLLQAFNMQVLSYLDSIKSNIAGYGSRFPRSGNFKLIPSNKADVMYRMMRTESRENKFGRSGKPYVLGSLGMSETLENIHAYGNNNEKNLTKQLDWFEPIDTDAISVPNQNAYDALLYLIDAGGIAADTWVYDFQVPDYYKMENERWDIFQMPQIVDGLPPIKIGYKDNLRKTNDLGTYATEEARINRTFEAMYWTTPVLFRAHSSVASDSPVIAYLLQK